MPDSSPSPKGKNRKKSISSCMKCWCFERTCEFSLVASSLAWVDRVLPGNPWAVEVDNLCRPSESHLGCSSSNTVFLRTRRLPTWRCRSSKRRRQSWICGTRSPRAQSTAQGFYRPVLNNYFQSRATRLYTRLVGPSVGPSVGPLVLRSFGPSVRRLVCLILLFSGFCGLWPHSQTSRAWR